MKSILCVYCLVLAGFISILFVVNSVGADGENWCSSLTDWSYRKLCTISDKVDDYSMMLVVGNSSGGDVNCSPGYVGMSNFSDIRFTSYSSNDTLLPFWKENYTSDTQATFWVNNSLNDTSIWMYYGYSSASDVSSGDDTFLFFDDFETDLSNWYPRVAGRLLGTISSAKAYQKSNSVYTDLSSDVDAACNITTQSCAVMSYMWDDSSDTTMKVRSICLWNSAMSSYFLTGVNYLESTTNYHYRDGAGYGDSGVARSSSWHKFDIRIGSSNSKLYIDGNLVKTSTYITSSNIAKINYWQDDSFSIANYIDCFIVRSYFDSEPSWSSFGSEESQGAGATVPTVTTNTATGVEETNATLRGTLTSNGTVDTTCWFLYGDETPPTDNNVSQGVKAHGASFSYNWQSLTPGVLYYFNTKANNSEGWDETGGIKSFLTKPNEPTGASCSAGEGWINVSWTGATGADRYLVRYKSGSSPTSVTDGTLFDNVTILYVNKSIGAGTHYFSIWSYAYESSPALYQYSDSYDTTSGTELVIPTWYSESFGGSATVTFTPLLSFSIVCSSGALSDEFHFQDWSLGATGVGFTTQYNVSEDNQTGVVPALNISNTGNVPLNFTIYWVSNPGSGISMKYNTSYSAPDPSMNLIGVEEANETLIVSNLGISSYEEIWLWMDFVSVSSGSGEVDVTIVSSEYGG